MQRSAVLNQVTDPLSFPFWIPVITHYRADGSVDAGRMRLHAAELRPHTRFWMVAGTTGDGWELSDTQYSQILDYALSYAAPPDPHPVSERPWIIVGALRPTTAEVLARVKLLKEKLGIAPQARLEDNLAVLRRAGITGVTVCPPAGPDVTQEQMAGHIAAVCEEARLPVIVYQLPQITRNLILPGTLQKLAERYPQIIMFKDSGGGDEVAASGLLRDGPVLVRGAEGRYLEALKMAGGWYDGWLLSTGNAFAPQLVEIYALFRAGERERAAALSRRLTSMVERIFALAQSVPGSAFSNANRAADHLRAYGPAWRDYPLPLLRDGTRLPAEFIAGVEAILSPSERGYAL